MLLSALKRALRPQIVPAVMLVFVMNVSAQTFDFEHGLENWTPKGMAFDAQPVAGSHVLTDYLIPVKLKGDYWHNLTYPIGQHGDYLITTAVPRGDTSTGTLTSN